MENQDFFKEIAMTKHPIGVNDKEVMPVPVPDTIFAKEKECKSVIGGKQELTFEKECERFQEELEALRLRYRSFMQTYLPAFGTQVEAKELKEFQFRYQEKGEVFTERNAGEKIWEKVTIPDYRGPAAENGKWNGYYQCAFQIELSAEELLKKKKRAVLYFQCVDYIAEVYVNGNYVGRHEGLFAPFSFDATDYIREVNELCIVVKNDIPILGVGPVLDGDKIYAATGPGWDDPQLGWHHCPAGAGIFGKVALEIRPEIYVEDVFVRPDIDKGNVELRLGIYNYTDEVKEAYPFEMSLLPRNYQGEEVGGLNGTISYIGPGKNEYRYAIGLKEYRLWEPESPWLYTARVKLLKEEIISAREQNFGMKKFISDENSTPKGKFYFNNRPIMLRGANEMGHLQQCVMKGDFDQLVDDILIAKMCNMNYYRVTQRPVQEEIYDYFDMLGMMHQCDFPLFGFLRRPQFAEAIKQAQEMEHLVRRHVSTVLVTFINEPMCIRRTKDSNDKFSKRYEAKGHRHLLRDELEAFFVAARKAIYVENPDRVIKNVEGDYDGPTGEGLADFHCYTMWYTNHGQPIGKLLRGYLPPIKSGWMTGCGEYGAEGLDNENIIRDDYPKEWLREEADGSWYPDKIVKSQTHSVQGDWYEEQSTITDWVRESQIHQANATRMLTEAYRRRGDIINHTAIHLLIDAWPSGWMKTLLDYKRNPKRAFFAYREALIPLRINLYTGRNALYRDEETEIEAWVLNDTGNSRTLTIRGELFEAGNDNCFASYRMEGEIPAATALCLGKVPIKAMGKGDTVEIRGGIIDERGQLIHSENISMKVHDRSVPKHMVNVMGEDAENLCMELNIAKTEETAEIVVSSSLEEKQIQQISDHAKAGGRSILLLPQREVSLQIENHMVELKGCGGLFFAAATEEWKEYNVSMLYNKEKGYIDTTSDYTIRTELPGKALIYTYDKQGFNGSHGAKPHLPFVKECLLGAGTLVLICLADKGRTGCNPRLDKVFTRLIEG